MKKTPRLIEVCFDILSLLEMTQWTQYWIQQKFFCLHFLFCLLPTDVAWYNILLLCSCCEIGLAYCFGNMAPVTVIVDEIYL